LEEDVCLQEEEDTILVEKGGAALVDERTQFNALKNNAIKSSRNQRRI